MARDRDPHRGVFLHRRAADTGAPRARRLRGQPDDGTAGRGLGSCLRSGEDRPHGGRGRGADSAGAPAGLRPRPGGRAAVPGAGDLWRADGLRIRAPERPLEAPRARLPSPAGFYAKLLACRSFFPMLEPTPLYGGNAAFLDALYEQYLLDPASVDERWRKYFAQLAPAGAERAHGPIRAEFAHMSDSEERLWLQDEFQQGRLEHRFSPEEQRNILWQLTAAEGLERYLHTKYVGQKRFSLEGADAFIPLLDDLIQGGGAAGIEEVVIGMAHRGRLNVLVNLLGKSPAALFSEFEGAYDPGRLKGSGDVKYHKGFSADLRTAHGNVHTALAFNPSHLEVVDPVVEGSVRARQERRGDVRAARVLALLVHGDAAFAGQGVVMQTLQLSQVRGFFTGGNAYVIINNHVGFTTSAPADLRSTMYCSDVAKMLEVPIFHVNADDPEAVVFVGRLALKRSEERRVGKECRSRWSPYH